MSNWNQTSVMLTVETDDKTIEIEYDVKFSMGSPATHWDPEDPPDYDWGGPLAIIVEGEKPRDLTAVERAMVDALYESGYFDAQQENAHCDIEEQAHDESEARRSGGYF